MKYRYIAMVFISVIIVANSAHAQNQYNLPQVANGLFDSYICRTTFVLYNNSNTDANVVLTLNDDNGNSLVTTLGSYGTDSQFIIDLAAGTTGFLQTDGTGVGVVGAATVTSNTPIGVSAIFTLYDKTGAYLTEAGVGSSDLLTDFVLPVDSSGPFSTGLALFNPGTDASINLTLVNADGSQADSTTLSLKQFNHIARLVAGPQQLFPAVANFRGTLWVHSSSPISAVVLRLYQEPLKLCYTSLPVVSQLSTQLSQKLSQVANGSFNGMSFKNSFLVFNISSSPADVTLALTQNDGSPLTVGIPGTGTNSTFHFTLAARASVILQTDGVGPGMVGAATLTSSLPVGASAVFTLLDPQGQFKTEAGVGNSPVLTSLTVPVDVTGQFETGVAFLNPAANSVSVTLKLLGANGVIVNSVNRTLPANNHLAIFVHELFPGIANFRGSLAISATAGIAAIALRQCGAAASFTTLPIASGVTAGNAQVAPYLTQTITGVTAVPGDPDVALSTTLAAGSVLSGTISGAGRPFTVVARGTNGTFVGQANPLTGGFGMVVPDGNYTLTAYYQPAGVVPPATLILAYTDPVPVAVLVTGNRDIALPTVNASSVSGNVVSSLGTLFSGSVSTAVFTATDFSVQGQLSLDQSGNFQGLLPAGSYNVSVSATPIQFLPLQTETLQLYNLGSLSVSGATSSGNYTTPPVAKIAGSVSGGSPLLTSIPSGTIVTANDKSAPVAAPASYILAPASSSASTDVSGQYQMVLAKNRSFELGVDIPFTLQGTSLPAQIHFTPAVNPLNLQGDSSVNFNIPLLSPPAVAVFGSVNDGAGHALANVRVTARSQSISGAPNVSYSVTGTTDVNGNYRLWLLSGSNYNVTFEPPMPRF